MLPSLQGLLGSVRWRAVILTLVLLSALHFVFIDNTLRNSYSSAVAAHKNYAAASSTFTPAPFEDGDTDEYLAICVSVKDQYADLGEWLTHYYHHHKIRRFYIMDDGSSPVLATLNYTSFVDPRALTHRYYHPLMHGHNQQLTMYDECIALFRHKHRWMAFLDADEFLEVRGNETLHGMLRDLDADPKVGALAVNWRIHSSSGLLKRPASSRKAFVTCIENADPNHEPTIGRDNEHIKSIVKTHLYERPLNPHKFATKDNSQTVGENGDVVDRYAWRVPITHERISVHHYASKSREQFAAKINRGNGMGDPKSWAWWDRVEALPYTICEEMTKYDP